MARIVVADDNSNIQRMVGLALKDQGIDVVAVGNGEAAVKKITELHPDLVLADVFMPVRNGYEVCEYVKKDPSLAHIPVILLVGAFDPLDEQEAQRVGADGVLKKPFVPPDPLIAMVKAALLRAGVSLSRRGSEKAPAESRLSPLPPSPISSVRKAADMLAPKLPTPISKPLSGVAFSGTSSKPEPPESPASPLVSEESFVDVPSRPQPVQIDAARNTMAFGDLLRPVSTSDAPEFVSSSESTKESDWRALEETDEVPEEVDEEVAQESAPEWRREGPEAIFTGEDAKTPEADWRDSPVLETVGRKSARETWEPNENQNAEDKGGFVTAADVPTEMDTFVTEAVVTEPETTLSNFEPPPQVPDFVSTHTVAFESSQPASPDLQDQAHSSDLVSEPAVGLEPFQRASREIPFEAHATTVTPQPVLVQEAPPVGEILVPRENTADVAEKKSGSWLSRLLNPWDAGTGKTNSLTSAWGAGNVTAVDTAGAPLVQPTVEEHTIEEHKLGEHKVEDHKFEEVLSAAPSHITNELPTEALNEAPSGTTREISHEVVNEAPNEISHEIPDYSANQSLNTGYQSLQNELPSVVSDEPAEIRSADESHPLSAAPDLASTPRPDMDALVASVLSKLSPEMLQAVTREILKPVVAAMVAEELNSKK